MLSAIPPAAAWYDQCMQKITPSLWFDTQAEEAAQLYVSLFKNSKITDITRYDEASAKVSGQPAGSVLTIAFELDGQKFVALNGGPIFKFTEAVSFIVDCETQEEIDMFWDKLIAGGGAPSQCGWLKDKFGLSWQIVPTALNRMIGDKDPAKAKRTMEAMLKMTKLDIAGLQKAYEGSS